MEGRLEIVLPDALNVLEVDRILGDLATPARVIVLKGGPEAFCRGLSLELAANDADGAVRCVQRLANLVLALGKASAPVVALVEGRPWAAASRWRPRQTWSSPLPRRPSRCPRC